MLISRMSSCIGPQQMLKRGAERARFISLIRGFLLWCGPLSILSFSLLAAGPALGAPAKDRAESDRSLSVEVPETAADVVRAIVEVSQDQIIHGTYVYEKDRTLTGAHSAPTSAAFSDGSTGGKVFYKVADNVIAPRNFKGSNDVGTITVRYIAQETGATSTALRIDAVFIESSGHGIHPSEGAVELAEYDAIKSHLQVIHTRREQEQNELRKLQQEDAERRALAERRKQEAQASAAKAESAVSDLQQRVDNLRRQVEARTKASGVPLKAAPYRSASTLQSLSAKSEVVILVVTQYWYGVETQDGHHGWIRRTELEPLP